MPSGGDLDFNLYRLCAQFVMGSLSEAVNERHSLFDQCKSQDAQGFWGPGTALHHSNQFLLFMGVSDGNIEADDLLIQACWVLSMFALEQLSDWCYESERRPVSELLPWVRGQEMLQL